MGAIIMSMLLKPENRMAFAKVGLYGRAGAGKTFTASQIAIGLHKYAKCNKPVAMFDTEPAHYFVKPFFEKAGIEFLVYDKSRALSDLLKFMDEAEKECSIIIIDSITHIWRDCVDSYLKKINETRKKYNKKPIQNVEFQHWAPIKSAFAQFTEKYLTCRAHTIVCGRAGDIYQYQKNEETGKMELVTNGMRMATEKEMGHEPSLLIEMFSEREANGTVNKCLVEKDRSNRINGKIFANPSFETFKPHFDFINIGGDHFESLNKADSKDLFTETGDDNWTNEKKQREIWCEEIQGLITKYYPSRSASDNQIKSDLIHDFFGTRSWTKVQSLSSDEVKLGFYKLKVHLESLNNKSGIATNGLDKSWDEYLSENVVQQVN